MTETAEPRSAKTRGDHAPGARGARTRARAAASSPAGRRPEPTLKILETRVLRGPNYWAREPVIRMLVDLGALKEYPSNKVPGFTDALVALVPTLEDHACSLGRRGGFVTRLREGTWVGHIAEHIALEFQNLAGTDVRHGKTRSAGPRPVQLHLRVPRGGGRSRGRKMAVALVNHLVAPDDPAVFFDFAPELERLIRLAERQAFGPSTQALIDEAVSRDIPFIRLDRHSLVQFGHGVYQQRIRATMTSRTSAIGSTSPRTRASPTGCSTRPACPSRGPTSSRPRSRPSPSPSGSASRAWSSRSTATTAAASTSTCAPTRPSGRLPRGARAESSGDVVVETYVAGNDYRCLVIGGKVAAIAERVPASVTGDGEHTVRQLVDIANADPRRGIGHEKVLTRIKIDDAADGAGPRPGPRARSRAGRRHLRQARADRQHVHRRDIDRSNHRGASRQRRDRRDRGADRRAGRRGHRLHLPGHHNAGARGRRRDRRGQRGTRLPDAHPPDRGRAAVRRPTRHRFAVPGRVDGPHPDRRP